MPASFIAAGIQHSNAGTRINLANPSLLETCPVQGEAAFGRQPTNGFALSAAIQRTKVEPTAEVVVISLEAGPTPIAVAATEDPAGSAPESVVAATSTPNDDDGKPGVPKWVWIVVGVAIALIAIGLSLGLFLWCRRRRAVVPDEEESAGDTRKVADVTQQEPLLTQPGRSELISDGGQVAPPETGGDTLQLDDIVEDDDDTSQPAGRKRRVEGSKPSSDLK